jgi:Arc/MetJ-type ribon-helix-helix transcriptional regulator
MSYKPEKDMGEARRGLASVSLGSTKDIALRLVAEGRFETLSEACRAGLRRLDEDARIVDRLVALGAAGMASGVDDGFDSDAFVEEARAGRTG